MKLHKFKSYQYPLEDKEGKYYGYYSIKAEANPVGFPGEKLIGEFEVYVKEEI